MDVLTVAGALEIPATIAIALDAAEKAGKPYDAVVALGCVIRGETGHYDIVAGESARALMDLSVARRIPLANGILTVENEAAGLGPRARRRIEQGRRRGGGGARRAAHQAKRPGGLIMAKPAERSRRPPRCRPGALPDGRRRQGRDRRARRVRGLLDRPRGRGHRRSSRPTTPSSATSCRAWSRTSAPST